MGGRAQVAGSVTLSSALQLVPAPLARILALLPLLGLLALRGTTAWFVWTWFAGMALAIALFARPGHAVWGFGMWPWYVIGRAWVAYCGWRSSGLFTEGVPGGVPACRWS